MLKRTKIVATIGPACSSVEVLKEMVLEGCNVVRMNFSHGDYEDHAKVLQRIRQIDIELNTHTAILADLQGPKIRIGLVKEGGANLISGSRIIISTQDVVGDESVISTNYKNFPRDVSAGEKVLLDDGKIELVLYWEDKGIGIIIQTTGRNYRETEEIARLLKKEFDR